MDGPSFVFPCRALECSCSVLHLTASYSVIKPLITSAYLGRCYVPRPARGRDASRPLSRISPSISRIARKKLLPFTPKWIGRYNRRDVKLLLRSWLWNAIARINRPSVIFTNQHRSHWRLCAGASGFGYMRNAQKKKDHEYCAAHFSFISTNTLATKSVRALVTPC